jgi:hypothetical protein
MAELGGAAMSAEWDGQSWAALIGLGGGGMDSPPSRLVAALGAPPLPPRRTVQLIE